MSGNLVAYGIAGRSIDWGVTDFCVSVGGRSVTDVPETQEQLDDVDNIQNLINERLSYMHDVKEDYYLLNGTGSTPR